MCSNDKDSNNNDNNGWLFFPASEYPASLSISVTEQISSTAEIERVKQQMKEISK